MQSGAEAGMGEQDRGEEVGCRGGPGQEEATHSLLSYDRGLGTSSKAV